MLTHGPFYRNCKLSISACYEWIMSPDKDTGRLNFTIVNSNNKTTVCEIAYSNPRKETLGKSRFKPVWSPKGIGKSHNMKIVMPACSLSNSESFRPELTPDSIDSICNLGKGAFQ